MLCALTIQGRQFSETMCKCLLSETLLATYLYIRLESLASHRGILAQVKLWWRLRRQEDHGARNVRPAQET